MAIRLAIDLAESIGVGEVVIRHLSPEADLMTQFRAAGAHPHTVFLVEDISRARAQVVNSLNVETIRAELLKADCYLIICVRADVHFPDAAMKRVQVEPLAPIQIEALLLAHLLYYSKGDRRVERLMTEAKLQELLKTDMTPVQVDWLAYLLADGFASNKSLDETLRSFGAAQFEQVQTWLEDTADDVAETAFRLALAAFSGSNLTSIEEAARDLLQRLRPEPQASSSDKDDKSKPAVVYVSPLKRTLSKRLEAAHARRVQHIVPTAYSDTAAIEVIELKEPHYSQMALRYIWNEASEWRLPLVDWLCHAAVSIDQALQMRAAGAIGVLATVDFDFICSKVFRVWAEFVQDDDKQRERHHRAIANALGVLVWDSARSDDVIGLLRSWVVAGRKNERTLLFAAANAYAQVGLRYPLEAIRQWRKIIELEYGVDMWLSDDLVLHWKRNPLHECALSAMSRLFLSAAEYPYRQQSVPVYKNALMGLSEWVTLDIKEKNSEKLGLRLFVWLMGVRWPPDDNSGSREDWPPAMLHTIVSNADESYRSILAGLLRSALNRGDLGQAAINALHMWTECADKDVDLENTLAKLLQDVIRLSKTPERDAAKLQMYLSRWRDHYKKPIAAAGRIHQMLFEAAPDTQTNLLT